MLQPTLLDQLMLFKEPTKNARIFGTAEFFQITFSNEMNDLDFLTNEAIGKSSK